MTLAIKRDWRFLACAAGVIAGGFSILPLRVKVAGLAALAVVAAMLWMLHRPQRWIGALLISAIALPPLPIELGNSGPHICLLAALAGLLAGIATGWRIPSTPLTRALFAIFFAMLTSIPMAALLSGVSIAGPSLVRVLLFGISVYVFIAVSSAERRIDDDTRLLRFIFYAALAAALFACVDYYFHFPAPAGFAPQFVWLSSGIFRRAQGVFYEASTLGNFCAFFLVMILVALSRKSVGLPRPLLAGGAFVFAGALVLSYSRASVINVLVSGCALLFLRRGTVRWSRILPVVAICIAATSVALATFFPALTEAYQYRVASIVDVVSSPEGTLSGRVGNWQSLVQFIAEQPQYALLGIGYKTIPFCGLFGAEVVADNVYLGMLVETGILGFAAVLCLNATILRATYRASRLPESPQAFFATWMFCFWAGESVQMLSGDLLTYWRVLPLYFWALAVATRPDNR